MHGLAASAARFRPVGLEAAEIGGSPIRCVEACTAKALSFQAT